MTAAAVGSASNIQLDVADLRTRRRGLIQPAGAHCVHMQLQAQDQLLELPQSLFSLVELRFGVVVRVRTTLHDDHLPPDAAFALIHDTDQRLGALGFDRAGDELSDATILKQLDATERARASRWCAPWGSGTWRAELWLKRVVRAGTELADVMEVENDACLVTLVVWDEALDRTGEEP